MLPLLLLAVAAVSANEAIPGISPLWNKDDYIVGGSEAPPGAYPWQISLERCGIFGCSHTCGAVLISAGYALTAGHCVEGAYPSNFAIVVGQHVRESVGQGDPRRITPSSIVIHPLFINGGQFGFPNDIAVMRLSTQAPIDGRTVNPAALPASHPRDYTSADCWISGWGRIYGGGPSASRLQHANTNVISVQECNMVWGNIDNYHICLYDRVAAARGGCQGDSGGPLQCNVGQWEVAGLTSWGDSMCDTRKPSVYARTSYFRTWIRQQTGV